MNVPVRIVSVGNSRAFLIPAIVVRELGLEVGAVFDLDASDKKELRLTARQPAKKGKK